MTAAAREFVTATTFQALSGHPVRTDLWDGAAEAAMGHIELARWADLLLVAPASADFLARLAHGLADDLLSTLALATAAPIAVAPAMNQLMWGNAATQSNVASLQQRGVRVLGPGVGDQACGEVGPGRMLEPLEIAALIAPLLSQGGALQGQRVPVTAGPTRECIDPVRFVSNRSSGKMGFAVAQAMHEQGAEVVLVSGPVTLATPAGVRRIDVESCEQMYAAVQRELPGTAIFVGTAAVADYRPLQCAPQKIKKTSESLGLELTRTVDILAHVSASTPRPSTAIKTPCWCCGAAVAGWSCPAPANASSPTRSPTSSSNATASRFARVRRCTMRARCANCARGDGGGRAPHSADPYSRCAPRRRVPAAALRHRGQRRPGSARLHRGAAAARAR